MIENDLTRALTWCLIPELKLAHTWQPANFRLRVYRLTEPSTYMNVLSDESSLAIFTTENQRRNLAPIFPKQEPQTFTKHDLTKATDTKAIKAQVKTVLDYGAQQIRQTESSAHLHHWRHLVHDTHKNMHLALNVLKARQPDLVFVSTQHDSRVRAWLLAAQSLDIPSVYIPHAPVANNNFYHDLPVSHAALRGQAEVDYYRDHLNLTDPRVVAVGDVSLESDNPLKQAYDPNLPGILALSPVPKERLELIVSLVVEADLKSLVVAPHPRSDINMLRELTPAAWRINIGERTADLMARGAAFVIQSSSGVALESAALGIPTANLVLNDEIPNYPLHLDPQLVTPVSTGEELAAFVDRALSDGALATMTMNASVRWREATGDASRRILRDFLETRDRDTSFIYDGWKTAVDALLRNREAL